MRYTTSRTSLALKKFTTFSPLVLRHKWVKNQFTGIIDIATMATKRRAEAFGSYLPKKKHYYRKLKRILLSKPLFKHTSFNLIIDLFLFNNKTYKLKRLKNLILRRSTYKYMYSMFADYQTKIQETMNRPRFFYMNIIDPSIFFFYKRIVNYYRALLSNKPFGIYLFLIFLQLNSTNKQSTYSINNKSLYSDSYFIEKEKNSFNSFTLHGVNTIKSRIYTNTVRKENIESNKQGSTCLLLNNNNRNYQLLDINKTLVELDTNNISNETIKKIKKNVVIKKPQYLKYKKYFNVLEKKTDILLDPKSLNLLNSDHISNITSSDDIKKIEDSNKHQNKLSKSSGFRQNNRKGKIKLNNKESDINEILNNSGIKYKNPKFLFNKIKKIDNLQNDSINFDYTNNYTGDIDNISNISLNKDNNKVSLTKLSLSNKVKDINHIIPSESIIKEKESYYKIKRVNKDLNNLYSSFCFNKNDNSIKIKKGRKINHIALPVSRSGLDNQRLPHTLSLESMERLSKRLVINKKSINKNNNLNKVEHLNKVNHELFSIKRSKYLFTNNNINGISNKSL